MMRESRALGLRLLTKPWSPRKKDRQDRPPHNQVRESRALAARKGNAESARERERERKRERLHIYCIDVYMYMYYIFTYVHVHTCIFTHTCIISTSHVGRRGAETSRRRQAAAAKRSGAAAGVCMRRREGGRLSVCVCVCVCVCFLGFGLPFVLLKGIDGILRAECETLNTKPLVVQAQPAITRLFTKHEKLNAKHSTLNRLWSRHSQQSRVSFKGIRGFGECRRRRRRRSSSRWRAYFRTSCRSFGRRLVMWSTACVRASALARARCVCVRMLNCIGYTCACAHPLTSSLRAPTCMQASPAGSKTPWQPWPMPPARWRALPHTRDRESHARVLRAMPLAASLVPLTKVTSDE